MHGRLWWSTTDDAGWQLDMGHGAWVPNPDWADIPEEEDSDTLTLLVTDTLIFHGVDIDQHTVILEEYTDPNDAHRHFHVTIR